MDKVTRVLFRQLLRWNRLNHVINTPFQINLNDIKYNKFKLYLPEEYHDKCIENSEGLQQVLFYIFRNAKYTTSSVNDSFELLKYLNSFSTELFDKHHKHVANKNVHLLSCFDFQVGEVVRHKHKNYRGIVIGYEIDLTPEGEVVQEIKILIDMFDLFKLPIRDQRHLLEYNTSKDFERVEESELKYIHHIDIDDYFTAYDESKGRYVPNLDLSFNYSHDSQVFRQLPDIIVNYPYDDSVIHSSVGNNSSEEGLTANMTSRLGKIIDSSISVLKTSRSFASTISRMMMYHSITPIPASSSLFQLKNHSSFVEAENLYSEVSTVGAIVLQDVMDDILKLEFQSQSMLSQFSSYLSTSCGSSNSLSAEISPFKIYKRLNRGGIYAKNDTLDFRIPVKSLYERTLIRPTERSSSLNVVNLDIELDSAVKESLIPLNTLIQASSKSISFFNNCHDNVDKLLQLRFQSYGDNLSLLILYSLISYKYLRYWIF